MLLNSLHIKGFRGFTDFKVEGLGQVNLIVGRNNAGKTSLLEAIYLLKASVGDPFLALNRAEDLGTSQLDLFNGRPATDGTGTIKIETSESASVEVILGHLRIRIKRPGSEVLDFGLGEAPFVIPAASPVFVGPRVYGKFGVVSAWERILLTPEENDVTKCLKIVVPGLERVAMIGAMPIVQVRDEPARITMGSLGDGVTRLFHLACGLVVSKENVLLVDEIENGVHYSILGEMWEFILSIAKELDIQVFATTHSLDCLRGFAQASHAVPEVVAKVIRLDNHKGNVVAVMFDEEEFQVAAEEEIEIR